MLLEPRKNIEVRQAAGRRWLEAYAEKTRKGEQEHGESERALAVIVLTHKTSDYLAEHDPQALKQAQKALDGTSWEDYPEQLPPWRDVDVIPADALDEADALKFNKPWLVQWANGEIREYDTEEEACAIQRAHRTAGGKNPMTGE